MAMFLKAKSAKEATKSGELEEKTKSEAYAPLR